MSSKYNVITAGAFRDGMGACSWSVLDEWGRAVRGGEGRLAGRTGSLWRMFLRAVFEGLRRVPKNGIAEVWCNGLPPKGEQEDIRRAVEKVIAERGLLVHWHNGASRETKDLPTHPCELLWCQERIAEDEVSKVLGE